MQNPRYAEDISVDTSNKSKLRKLLEDNPIEALTSGPSSLAFKYQTDSFGLATTPPSNLIPVLTDLLAEIVDWRLAEYLSRLEGGHGATVDDPTDEGGAEANDKGGLWDEYMREKIPPLFSEKFNSGKWNQGIVMSGQNMILLVTLKKENLSIGGNYEDVFLDPKIFSWQSQNRTTQDSTHGRIISGKDEGYKVHLFVRAEKLRGKKAAPFIYCGEMNFVSWEGEKPISVKWRLRAQLPEHYHRLFNIRE